MFKKILVPSDASVYSERALAAAAQLAQQFQSEVVALHVVMDMTSDYGDGELIALQYRQAPEELIARGKKMLENFLTKVNTEGVKISSVVEIGYPPKVIQDYVEKEKIDLIVMGSHGHGPLAGALLGSVSQRVLQSAPCPVLIVK